MNQPCVLRYGVDHQLNKSFLCALSLVFIRDGGRLEDMFKRLNERITIDNILYFHKGNIPQIFCNDNELDSVDLSKYQNTKMYQTLYDDNPNRSNMQLKRLINGFENFMKYVNDENEYVDYTYLWDIVISGILFDKPKSRTINLIVIKDNNNDITNNLSIICPNSSFSNYLYHQNRYSLIIYEKDGLFEPLVTLTRNGDDKTLEKFFDLHNVKNALKQSLININKNIQFQCNNIASDEQYVFDESIDVFELYTDFNTIFPNGKYLIVKQVINFDSKVIGVLMKRNLETNEKNEFFVPLKQSALHSKLKYALVNDEMWNEYHDTKVFLMQIYEDSNQKIKCNPKFKVVEMK